MAHTQFGSKTSNLKRLYSSSTFIFHSVRHAFSSISRFIILVITSTIFVYICSPAHIQQKCVDSIQTSAINIAVPIVAFINKPFDWLNGGYYAWQRVRNMSSEYERLVHEKQTLEEWKSLALQLRRENKQLRELLHTVPMPKYSFYTAKALGAVAEHEYSHLVIAATTNDGIRKDAPVLCAQGLIGRVSDIGPFLSRVTLLTNINARTPVRFESTGEQAILAGTGTHELIILHRKSTRDVSDGPKEQISSSCIQINDRLITSGVGGIYPPDIPVAYITRIVPDPGGHKIYATLISSPQHVGFVRILDIIDASYA